MGEHLRVGRIAEEVQIMEKRTHRLMPVLLAGMLAVLLTGCGRAGIVDMEQREPGKLDAMTGTPTGTGELSSSAQEVRFGFFVFDNADGTYEVYSKKEDLDAITSTVSIDGFAEMGAELTYYLGAADGDSEVYCFRFEGSAAAPANLDTIQRIVRLVARDNSTYSAHPFGEGLSVYIARSNANSVDNLMLFEIADNGINLIIFLRREGSSLDAEKRVSFTDGTSLSTLTSLPEAAADLRRVGSERMGFIDIPDTWNAIEPPDGIEDDALGWGDESGYMITMRVAFREEVGFSGTDDEFAMALASAIYERDEADSSVESIKSGTQEFACGLSSYFIECEWGGGTTLIQFIIVGDGACYYVSCSGAREYTLELAGLIVESFDPVA